MAELQIGVKIRCEGCGSEAIVISADKPAVKCCGQPVVVLTS